SWVQQASPATEPLYAIDGSSDTNVFAVGLGGIVLKLNTSTTPQSWEIEVARSDNPTLRAVGVRSNTLALAFGDQGFIRQYYQGNWTVSSQGRISFVSDVDFSSATLGWAVGSGGTVFRTTDAGATWTRKTAVVGENPMLNAVSAVSDTVGVAVGAGGTIYRTADGGVTWQKRDSGTSSTLRDVTFTDANRGWTVGSGGTLLRTTDGGLTWASVSSGTTEDLHAIDVIGTSTWIVVGANGTVRITGTSGGSWKSAGPDTVRTLLDVDFLTANVGWVVGESATVYYTFSGGRSWESRKPPYAYADVHSVTAIDAEMVWIAGQSGLLYRTTNTGLDWAYESPGTGTNLRGAFFIDPANGWIVGDGGAVLKRVPRANVKPVAVANTYQALVGTTLSVAAPGVLGNDIDADSDPLDARLMQTTLSGTLGMNADGSFTYTPDAGFTGVDTFTYRAFDGAAYSDAATVSITVNPPVIPIAGDNRFETAVKASQQAYPDGLALDGKRTVVIATGMNWPDALGGTSLAGALDGPVLLVNPTSIPDKVMTEIGRLKATKAIILGGTGAVSAGVEQALKTKLGTGAGIVRRIDGANRYETADKIAKEVIATRGKNYDGYAFVATGANFPDALAAAPLAAAKGWPLYLADPKTGLSSASKTAMAGVSDVVILGGTGAVSASTKTYLDGRFPGKVTRLDGTNRYQTAAKIAKYAVDTHGHTWNRVGITTGENFPDALAGGIVQGKAGSVMLLTTPTVLQADTKNTLVTNKSKITTVTFFGGTGAVSTSVRTAVSNAIK
ncbi:MAG: cell wall-binding repeat-containing protein, partial [Actinomycetota bacterium]|nr:cell wall-binding repeat-containing protein [Actinomycetota bacterium]